MEFWMYMLKRPVLWLAIAWSLVAIVIYLSLAPMLVELPAHNGDKYAHVAAYAALTFWFMQIYDGRRARILIVFGLVSLGVGLEIVQGYTGYRSFEYGDMMANTVGVALGWLIGPPRMPNMLLHVEKLTVRRRVR